METHAGILLDGVGDVQLLVDLRETLQGRAKAERGGKSATMVYSNTVPELLTHFFWGHFWPLSPACMLYIS